MQKNNFHQAPDAKKFLLVTVLGCVFGADKAYDRITISDMRLANHIKWENITCTRRAMRTSEIAIRIWMRMWLRTTNV